MQTEKEISEKEKHLKKIKKDLSKAGETVRVLKTGNPKLKTQVGQVQKQYLKLEQSLKLLKPYKDIFDRIEALKIDIKELDDIVLPPIENEVSVDIPNLEDYQTPEIKRKVNEFSLIYKAYGSLKGIEDQTELQKQQLENRRNIISTKKSGLYDLLKLLTKKDKSSFFGQLIAQQKTLSPAQETILFKVLQNVKWDKPENVVSGIRYVTNFEFIGKKNIEKDENNNGYWYNLGGVREFVPETDDKRMFGDIKMPKGST